MTINLTSQFSRRTAPIRDRAAAVLLLLCAVAPGVRAADITMDTLRTSVSESGPVAAAPGTLTTTTDVFAPLVQFGYRGDTAAETTARRQPLAVGAYSPYWFAEVYTDLLRDDNSDGYYQRFRVTFDVDTDYSAADVYARLYLSLNGGPWNRYYTTGDISIHGATSADAYSVVTTLTNGYPYGRYDVLIELYDAYTDELLTAVDSYDYAALRALPLQDEIYDDPYYSSPPATDEGGGGAFGWLEGVLLALLMLLRTGYARCAVSESAARR